MIPRTVLYVRKVGHKSSDILMTCVRPCGGIKDEEATRESQTRLEVEEGTGRLECRSKYWASEDRRDESCVTREAVRDEFREKPGDQRDELRKFVKFENTDSIRNRSKRHANDRRTRTN